MDTKQLKNLKHDLRTSVNHILGYSALLMEAANDARDGKAASEAQSIHGSGQALAKLVESSLACHDDQDDRKYVDMLSNDMRPVIQKILDAALSHSELFQSVGGNDDLKRICRAADQLLNLVHGRNLAPSK